MEQNKKEQIEKNIKQLESLNFEFIELLDKWGYKDIDDKRVYNVELKRYENRNEAIKNIIELELGGNEIYGIKRWLKKQLNEGE